jgi:hypothetical protein
MDFKEDMDSEFNSVLWKNKIKYAKHGENRLKKSSVIFILYIQSKTSPPDLQQS